MLPSTGLFMPCDAALLTGNAIVNESMLTGDAQLKLAEYLH